jgi:hypothetical protein
MKSTRKVAMVALALVLLTAAGTAYAIWSANGAGTGQARAITAQTITVTAATGAADLYPGFTDGDVFFTLTNPNPYPVTFTTMSPVSVTSSDPTGCPSSNVIVDSNVTGLSLAVGAQQTTGTLSIADVVTMSLAAPDGCQGDSFTIQLTLTGSQV